MQDNSSVWPPETLLAINSLSAWLATPFLLALAYLYYYSRANNEGQSRLANPKRTLVGKIHQLCIHPIKSCAGIKLNEVKFGPEGLENDRTFLIVDAATNRFITARKSNKMVLIRTAITTDPSAPHLPLLEVSFPPASGCPSFKVPIAPPRSVLKGWKLIAPVTIWSNTTDAYISQSINQITPARSLAKVLQRPFNIQFYSVDESQSPSSILSKFLGYPVHLVYKGPTRRMVEATLTHPNLPKSTSAKFQDGYPFLVASVESLFSVRDVVQELAKDEGTNISEEWKVKDLEMDRFRPNIIFKDSGRPFVEDELLNLAINDHQFASVSKCARCMLPNIDPATGIMDKSVPSTALAKFRKGLEPDQKSAVFFGCNAITFSKGAIHIGDPVYALNE